MSEKAGLTRRGFLSSIGLAGVALTLPKPLAVVAARMADLERPPIHAGVCEIPVHPGPFRFLLHGLSMSVPRGITRERYNDFYNGWYFCMVSIERLQNRVRRVGMYRIPVRFIADQATRLLQKDGTSIIPDDFCAHPVPLDSDIECWLTPQRINPPRHPLPPASVVFRGYVHQRNPDPRPFRFNLGMSEWYKTAEFKSVRLERARAIELGLCGPDEPEDVLDL